MSTFTLPPDGTLGLRGLTGARLDPGWRQRQRVEEGLALRSQWLGACERAEYGLIEIKESRGSD